MATLPTGPTLDVQLDVGRPPIVRVECPPDPAQWVAEHRDTIGSLIEGQGVLLVRGLGLRDPDEVGSVFRQLAARLMAERESFAPRERRADGVYSSMKWPANQQMCMHHELSYLVEIPRLLLFACLTAPDQGGATAVSDAAAVVDALPKDLVERFSREGWLLTRNYNDEIGASWQDAFGTEEPEEVERYCHAHAIELAWQPGGGLRTRQRRSAVLHHPVTRQRVWVNQIAFLNEWTLDPEIREYLVDFYGSDGLPFNTSFGDGSPIGADVVELLNQVYEAHTDREPWQAGDLMIVDNLRTAHSREAYEGQREVLVGLGDPIPVSACSPTIEVA